MPGPTPEQLLAINAMLQQGLQQDQAAQQQVSLPVTIQNASIGVDPNALTRNLTLEGTLTAATQGLDQLVMKTAAGEVVLKVQQNMDQQLLNLLPSRVTLQLRPGPDGLQAVLVVGNKPLQPDKPVESATSGTSVARSQTLTAEIPKINQIHQALVLPSSLFSSQSPEQFLASLTDHVQAKAQAAVLQSQAQLLNPQSQAKQVPNFFTGLLQKLGFTPPPMAANEAHSPLLEYAPGLPPSVASKAFAGATPAQLAAVMSDMPKPTAIKILGVATPEEVLKNRAALAAAADDGVEIAIVRGNTPSGQPVLSIGDKLIAVQGGKNWPVGMELKVSMGPQAGLIVDANGEPLDAQAWTGLREALVALAANSQASVADLARIRIPQPASTQLPGALLFFLAALQKGHAGWLGDETMRQLKSLNKEELIQKIEEQWRRQINQSAEGPGGEWRGVSIPLFDNEKMQLMKLYIYNPPGQDKQKRKSDPNWARRFLIDITLSRLGPVQFDGLVHHRRLELVVRTDRALNQELRSELVKHFQRTLEEVRYTGTLVFNAQRAGWVDIRETSAERIQKNM
jgi:hypothetical protein